MFTPIQPATLSFAPDGTPYSATFDDVYHTSAGGLGQARHVFLAGNGLPGRWQGRERWVIVETGFGLGLNFLATWQAWRADPARSARLDFVSVEKHPFQVGWTPAGVSAVFTSRCSLEGEMSSKSHSARGHGSTIEGKSRRRYRDHQLINGVE